MNRRDVPPEAPDSKPVEASPKPDEVVDTRLDDEELSRVDQLAAAHGVSRDRMLFMLVRAGLLAYEETLPPSRERPHTKAR
ncbi:Hypothetical protein A7982_05992 [Minicystis rosea]|nr:Hypothetical protein A7982_05992 [Minicystis rosea]